MTNIHVVPDSIEIRQRSLYTTYTATREDLITAGLATEDMFPVWPKRVKDNFAPDIEFGDQWLVRYLKGGRFDLTRWHSMEEPPRHANPWSQEEFKSWMLATVESMFKILENYASGEAEAKNYGMVTHRLSESDQKDLVAMRHRMVDLISRATVKRAAQPRPQLKFVKAQRFDQR